MSRENENGEEEKEKVSPAPQKIKLEKELERPLTREDLDELEDRIGEKIKEALEGLVSSSSKEREGQLDEERTAEQKKKKTSLFGWKDKARNDKKD